MNPANPRKADFDAVEHLGTGSFGVVYLVRRRTDGKVFAMKEMDLRRAGSMEFEAAIAEIEAMKALSHPNIVQLHEHWSNAGSTKTHFWLLLELCQQGTLEQFIDDARGLDDATVKGTCRDLLEALREFEKKKLVHNDLKPANVFINEGLPKIGDMGCSKFTMASRLSTRFHGGTPLYMPPEVVCQYNPHLPGIRDYVGNPVSYQSDVYSLGVVLWALKMGRHPTTEGEVLPVDSGVFRDEQLRACINDMLQRDSKHRPTASCLLIKHFGLSSPAPRTLLPRSSSHFSVGDFVCAVGLVGLAYQKYNGVVGKVLAIKPKTVQIELAGEEPRPFYPSNLLRLKNPPEFSADRGDKKVVITGLITDVSHNGKQGIVKEPGKEPATFLVKLDADGAEITFRQKNLRSVESVGAKTAASVSPPPTVPATARTSEVTPPCALLCLFAC